MDTEIVWEEPPAYAPAVPQEWVERLQPLLERPGQWARVGQFDNTSKASSIATRLRRKPHWVPEGNWEFRGAADSKTNSSKLYARYIGPKTNQKPK